ncbi:MAG: hypothetical protein V3T53_04595 [Phycisphaerales bacterium]
MTKQRLLGSAVCAVVLATTGVANADTYGNTSPFETQGNHSPNFLLGVEVIIPVDDFKLESFGMIYGHEDFGDPAISNAIFGLYTSGEDGLPESLVAVTNEINLSAQQTYDNIAFTTTPIVSAGTYWMMALYESSASPRLGLLDGSSLVAYWFNSYGDGMPGTAPAIITYTGQNFNYWVNGLVTPGKCPWDLDGSGSVGASDLLDLLFNWGPCPGCAADFDGDDIVGASDLLALLFNWGPCP